MCAALVVATLSADYAPGKFASTFRCQTPDAVEVRLLQQRPKPLL